MYKDLDSIKYIAFDADDTLWQNEIFFRSTEKEYYKLLEAYGSPKEIEAKLFEIEIGHLKDYGFGIKSFTLSMIETALKLSKNKLKGGLIEQIVLLGQKLLNHPLELIGDPEKVMLHLREKGYRLLLLTKGDLMDQNRKVDLSGLRSYFEHVVVMTDKKEEDYQNIFEKLNIDTSEILMIGNSLKSDVLPLINIGAKAIYVPHDTTWTHERISEDTIDTESYIKIESLEDIISKGLL